MKAALNPPRELYSHGIRRLVARQAATLSRSRSAVIPIGGTRVPP
jgi:hypothetical protein